MTNSRKAGFGKTAVSDDGGIVKSIDVLIVSFIGNI